LPYPKTPNPEDVIFEVGKLKRDILIIRPKLNKNQGKGLDNLLALVVY